MDIFVLENKITLSCEDLKIERKFETEVAKNQDKMKENFINAFKKTGESIFLAKKVEFKGKFVPFFNISALNELRRSLYSELEEKRLKNYKRGVQNNLKNAEYKDLIRDYRLNITNKKAEEFYKDCGVDEIEYSPEKTKNYDKKELMRTKHCIRYALNICTKKDKGCKRLTLIDSKGGKYPLKFDCKNCEMIVLNNT